MLGALFCDAVAVVAGEVEEVAFGDDVLTAGFEGLQPAAVQPTADGVHGVAKELRRFPLREGIGLAAPFIGEPLAQIGGRFGRIRALRGCPPPRRENGGQHVFFGVALAVLGEGDHVLQIDRIPPCLFAVVPTADDAVLQHPRAFALTDVEHLPYLIRGDLLRIVVSEVGEITCHAFSPRCGSACRWDRLRWRPDSRSDPAWRRCGCRDTETSAACRC